MKSMKLFKPFFKLKFKKKSFCRSLKPVNLNSIADEPSRFHQKFSKSKGLQTLLSRNYNAHFDSIRRWKSVYATGTKE